MMFKRSLIVVVILAVIAFSGCLGKSNTPKTTGQNNATVPVVTANPPKPSPLDPNLAKKLVITKNTNLTKMVLKEKHVIGAQIYSQNGMALGAVMMDKGATNSYATGIANKYVKLMKKKYKNLRINFQIVAGGKNLVTIDTK